MTKFSASFYIGVTYDPSLAGVKGVEFTREPEVEYFNANWETSAQALLRISPNHVLKSYENRIDYANDPDTGESWLYLNADFELEKAVLEKYFGDSDPENIDPENFLLVCGDFTFTTIMSPTSFED